MDVIAHVDSLPASIPEPGGCLPIDEPGMQELLSASAAAGSPPRRSPGGSACNVARGVSELLKRLDDESGSDCSSTIEFVGMAGDDETAREYEQALAATGVTPRLLRARASTTSDEGSLPPPRTATCLCLVTRDGQRTMRTYLGAAALLRGVEQLPEGWCDRSVSALHVEGYSLWRDGLASGAMRAARGSSSRGGSLLTSIDCASFEVVRARRAELEALLGTGLVDVVFFNEEEAAALAEGGSGAGRDDADADGDNKIVTRALRRALELGAGVAVASLGPKGARAAALRRRQRRGAEEQEDSSACYSCPAEPVDAVSDTVGAGDAFAAGFLASLLLDSDEGDGQEEAEDGRKRPFSGASIEAALRLGCAAGAAAVRASGADPGAEAWNRVAETARKKKVEEEVEKGVERKERELVLA